MSSFFSLPRQATWWRVLARAGTRWEAVDGDLRAAALAYFLLLSLVPLVIMLVTLGSLFVDQEVASRQVVTLINNYASLSSEQEDAAIGAVRGLLAARGKINLIAFALVAWGALKFLSALIRTTNRVWLSEPYVWWRLPLKSFGLLGITASAALVGIVLPAIAELIRHQLETYLELPTWTYSLVFGLIPWLVLGYGIVMAYKMAPNRPTKFAEVWAPALAVTLLIWIGERLFLLYAVNVARFNVLYGTVGGMLAFLVWVYLSCRVCVFGICACAALAEIRDPAASGDLGMSEPAG